MKTHGIVHACRKGTRPINLLQDASTPIILQSAEIRILYTLASLGNLPEACAGMFL